MRSVDLHLVPGRAPGAGAPGDPRPGDPRAIGGPEHSVRFYENDAFLAASVADFVADGIARDEPVLVIATGAHRRAFTRRLRAKGIDVDAARRDGLLAWHDADATLERIMDGALPDEARFRAELGPVLERAELRRRGAVVRAYGEMVDVLWQRGDIAAALRLEELWNELARTHRFALLCGYAMGPFVGTAAGDGRAAVCSLHTHVHEALGAPAPPAPAPDEEAAAPADAAGDGDWETERDMLRRHARSLAAEVAQRRHLERQLRAALADRRRTERELRRSRRLLVDAQRLARVGSWSFVPATGAAEWSEELWRVLGLDPLGGAPSLDRLLACLDPEDAPALRGLLQRAALVAERVTGDDGADDAEAPSEACEVRVRRPDGTVRSCEVRVVASPGGADRPPVLHGTLLDVTERREADAERRALDARLLETQRLETIGVLAGGIAHDFNNLLTSMLGNADLLRGGLRAGSPEHQLAGEVLLAGRRSADLTRQLLAYAGQATYVVRPLDLGGLAREVTALLRTALPPGGALRLDVPDAAARVAGDRAQLTQVLMNLVTNAAEALMAGGGEVRVRVRALPDGDPAAPAPLVPGPCVRVEVEDTGAGMSDATQARMFEPFFSTKGAGRGLGLAATLGIVRAHRGALSVRSASGAGTTVAVWLPDAGAVAGEAPPAAAEGARPSRLLVVDDDAAVRTTLARMLRRLGHEVVEAGAGAAALAALEAGGAIDLAIVDLSMPDARGEATAARLEDARPGLPVLITSGYWDGEGAPAVGRRALAKPYDLERLGRVVADALRP